MPTAPSSAGPLTTTTNQGRERLIQPSGSRQHCIDPRIGCKLHSKVDVFCSIPTIKKLKDTSVAVSYKWKIRWDGCLRVG
ncbi:hypothetical protein MRB53_004581 [Persea americana]|uniref:Uncharacterized protein n=1 Tax=Persea americana TaxID=3435 RepID=A0ACC2MB59_PERAE|nr:hypothetical protein MRB53_004581 [Persea americana]